MSNRIELAVGAVANGEMTPHEAVMSVTAADVEIALHAQFDGAGSAVTTGIGASPGAAVGQVYFDVDGCLDAADRGELVLLCSEETSPADEIARLRESVAHHNRLYHELDSPELPDVEFDLLVRRLRELEEQHPDLAGGPSPTSTVGGVASATFAPIEHAVPMMSLDNAMDEPELRAWGERLERGLDGADA